MINDDGRMVIENYLLQVSGNLPRQVAREVVPELRSHLIEEATTGNRLSVQRARRAVTRMGEPKTIAKEYSREYNPEVREKKVEKVAYTRTGSAVGTRQNLPTHTVPNHDHHDHPLHWIGAPVRWIGSLVKWTGSLIVKLILYGLIIGAVVSIASAIVLSFEPPSYYRQYSVIGGFTSFVTLLLIYCVLRTIIYRKPRFAEGTSRTYQGQCASTNESSSESRIRNNSTRRAVIEFPAEDGTKVASDNLISDAVVEDKPNRTTETSNTNYCPYCGEASPSDGTFCPNCGASIREEDRPDQNADTIHP